MCVCVGGGGGGGGGGEEKAGQEVWCGGGEVREEHRSKATKCTTQADAYPGVVGHKVDTDKVPSDATHNVEKGCSEPAKPFLHMTEHKECKQQ